MLNSDRKKISLTGCVSYGGGDRDVHLFLKINKTRRKCQVNCVGGLPKWSVTTRIAWGSDNYITTEDFLPVVRTKNKRTGGIVTTRFAALGTGLLPDGTGLRGRECPELYETHQNKKVKMIKRLKIMKRIVKKQARDNRRNVNKRDLVKSKEKSFESPEVEKI